MRGKKGKTSSLAIAELARVSFMLWTASAWGNVTQLGTGTNELMAKLLYGAGLRLMECIRLRVKDIDFENHHIIVRDGKGGKDRATVLPKTIQENLRFHLKEVRKLFAQELAGGRGGGFIDT
jgi:integrase